VKIKKIEFWALNVRYMKYLLLILFFTGCCGSPKEEKRVVVPSYLVKCLEYKGVFSQEKSHLQTICRIQYTDNSLCVMSDYRLGVDGSVSCDIFDIVERETKELN